MSRLSHIDLSAIEATAASAAAYLDACDAGAAAVRLDAGHYRACARLLLTLFATLEAEVVFPGLLDESPAARELAEALKIGRRIEVSRLGYYPELNLVLNRASA